MVLYAEDVWKKDNRKDTSEIGCVKLANDVREEAKKDFKYLKDESLKMKLELLLYVLYGQNKIPIKKVAKEINGAIPKNSSLQIIIEEILLKVS